MRLLRALLVPLLLLLHTIFFGSNLLPAPPAAAQEGYTPTFEAGECPFALPARQVVGETVVCGYLVVPENRGDPDSPTIRLAVAIFHPPGGSPEPDPIVYLEGGPGGSALEFLNLSFGQLFAPVLAANRDVIVLDQRGMGFSEPALDCPDYRELRRELLDFEVDGQELSADEVAERSVEALLACGEALSRVADLSAYNSAASAADINDLRLALGYERVNLWGVSYGTRLALGVMRDYPEAVRSAVLDSVFPPDASLLLGGLPNTHRAFEQLFTDCAADAACGEAFPDLRATFFDTVERLNASPARIDIRDPLSGERYRARLTGDGLVGFLFQSLYITDLIPSLPQVIGEASRGDYTTIEQLLGVFLGQAEALSIGAYFSVQCNEDLPFSDRRAFEAAAAQYRELAAFFERLPQAGLAPTVCAGWDSGTANAVENEPVRSDIPALLMAGQYDPITPPSWARRAAATLVNGYLFEYPATGHGASLSGECPRRMMLAFLEDPTTAPDDGCIAQMGGPAFVVPGEEAAVTLRPYTSQEFGLSGVEPEGWVQVGPGVRSRARSMTDITLLLQQFVPGSSVARVGSILLSQLGAAEAPEYLGAYQTAALGWGLFRLEVAVQGRPAALAMALAEDERGAYVILLAASPAEIEALYDSVFLPAVEALTPTAPEAGGD